jgi:soluble lytic murein transglycosylase-like protein
MKKQEQILLSNQHLLILIFIILTIFLVNFFFIHNMIEKTLEENAELRKENEEILRRLDTVNEIFNEAEKIKNYIQEKRVVVERDYRARIIPEEEITEISYGIVFTSKLFNISTSKITAVAWVETQFDRYAVGPCGEHGLIQVMKPTFNYIKKSMNLNIDFNNWRDTLIAGTIYLKDLEKKYFNYKNKEELVFAAYNAGPSRAPNVILQRASGYVQRATKTHNEIIKKL